MNISDVKPGITYESYNGDVWVVLEVLERAPGRVKFRELLLVGQAAGATQEATFHTDDLHGNLQGSTLLGEGR